MAFFALLAFVALTPSLTPLAWAATQAKDPPAKETPVKDSHGVNSPAADQAAAEKDKAGKAEEKKPKTSLNHALSEDALARSNSFSGAGVRLPLLPNRQITSAPADPFIKKRERVRGADKTEKAVKQDKQVTEASPEDKAAAEAAMAAFTAYKKRQLEALESDRKTLAALQSAIQELGLGKKLNMSQPNGEGIDKAKTAVGEATILEARSEAADSATPEPPAGKPKK